MTRFAMLLAMALAPPLVACSPRGATDIKEGSARARVLFQCDLADAEVWVDGRYFRSIGELSRGFRLRAGAHQIEVSHTDYHSMYYDLTVVAGRDYVIKVALARRLR